MWPNLFKALSYLHLFEVTLSKLFTHLFSFGAQYSTDCSGRNGKLNAF